MIYLDNAATTRMFDECADVYREYAVNNFYNPSASYDIASDITNDINRARKTIADSLNCGMSEIYFTASGSESDNLALFGCVKKKNKRIIISSVEHAAIYNSAIELKNQGYDVVSAPVDKYGKVDIDAFLKLLNEDTVMVSVMHVCNETGAVNDIGKLCALTKEISPTAVFHSDGVQAYMKIESDVKKTGVDAYSVSAHKVNGPKGVGALYIRKGLNPKPIIFGGGQESGLRSATENVGGIMAFAKAVELNSSASFNADLESVSEELLSRYGNHILLNTDFKNAAPHILSVSLDNVRGEVFLHAMEDEGVLIGTGSACSSKKATKRIPNALRLPPRFYDGMLRISIDKFTHKEDVKEFLSAFDRVYGKLKNYK